MRRLERPTACDRESVGELDRSQPQAEVSIPSSDQRSFRMMWCCCGLYYIPRPPNLIPTRPPRWSRSIRHTPGDPSLLETSANLERVRDPIAILAWVRGLIFDD